MFGFGFLHKKDKESEAFYGFFKNILGFRPRNTALYKLAFLHKSRSKEIHHGIKLNNERLEYLGDAVLSAIVADFLFKKYPYQGEGFLTEMRSKIVSRNNLNRLAQKIGLSGLIRYNRDSQGIYKSIDGDAFEALVGAIYLEKGYKFTRHIVIDRLINVYMDIDNLAHSDWNFKSKLIDWGQKERKKVSFEVVQVINKGPRKQYETRVLIDGVPHESAIDFSIKAAEQLAAEKTYKKMFGSTNNNPPEPITENAD
ncbi:MAG: ribonuclease III [Muribaculaceae bacterium]|nr:ribonuclease III [Muribaculaceae bacterium]